MTDYPALTRALEYCRQHQVDIPLALVEQLRELGLEIDQSEIKRSVGDYPGIRSRYYTSLVETIVRYLTGDGTIALPKGHIKKEMGTAFVDAFETGWLQGAGGDKYEPEPDDTAWLATRTDQELGYIDSMFVSMREMRQSATDDDPLTLSDIDSYAEDRASGYARTLDGVFAQGKLRGKKNIMLTFDGPDGKESCTTCKKYKSKSHRAKWWTSHELIPTPGNENFECGCYQCQHVLRDKDGVQWAGVQE